MYEVYFNLTNLINILMPGTFALTIRYTDNGTYETANQATSRDTIKKAARCFPFLLSQVALV